jgi:hypothetical protein
VSWRCLKPDIVAASACVYVDPLPSVNLPESDREPLTPPGVNGSDLETLSPSLGTLAHGWMRAPGGVVVIAIVGHLGESAAVGVSGVDVPAGCR